MKIELSEREKNTLVYALNFYEGSRHGLYEWEVELKEKLINLSKKEEGALNE